MTPAIPFRTLAAPLLALLLGACVGGGGQPTRFYILTPLDDLPPAAATTAGRQPPVVEIASLRLPEYLERPQIVSREERNRLALAELHQWGGNLRKEMTRVLADNLSRLLATPEVTIAPNPAPTTPSLRLDVEVLQFERGPDRRVHLLAQWRLSQGRGRAQAGHLSRLASPPLAEAEDYDATVAAMSELLGELSREIAAAVRGAQD